MNDNKSSSWSFEYPFHFESDASLEQVVRSLAQLEEEGGFFSSSRNDISILPDRNGYSFRYRIRRRNKSTLYTTASGVGQVSETDYGVIVEGQAQIEAWSFYSTIALFMFLTVFLSLILRGAFGFFPLFLLVAGAFTIFQYYRDRNLVVDHIGEAVASTNNMTDLFRRGKDKRAPIEKAKNTRLNSRDVTNPNSVWNEAISEYEDDRGYDEE